jgi:hypothetical protein
MIVVNNVIVELMFSFQELSLFMRRHGYLHIYYLQIFAAGQLTQRDIRLPQ